MKIYEVRSLEKVYGKNAATGTALDGINLTINKGEMVAIIGKSGSGKSTLLNLLAGLIPLTQGTILFKQENMVTFKDKQMASYRNKNIGYIVQNFGLISTMTVLKNVLLPMKRKKDALKALGILKQLGMEEKADKYPHELSGGERQRVAIARALINDPDVILADEPTGALDSENGANLMDIFKALNQEGLTLVIVTHDEGIASQCNHRIKLKDGKVIEDILENQ